MKTIQLTQGKVALVDDEDFEKVIEGNKWCARFDPKNGRWNAVRSLPRVNGKQTSQQMHRFIMGLEPGDAQMVDHINREATLDNRRSNLRVATGSQNQHNRGTRKNSTSGVKGVSWFKRKKRWHAQIGFNGQNHHLGYFPTLELAAAAYDDAAIQLHGPFAVTNASLGLFKKPVLSVAPELKEEVCQIVA